MAGCNTRKKAKKMKDGGMTQEPSKGTAERMEAATKAGLKNPLGSAVARMLDKATSGDSASGKKQYDKFYNEAKKAKKMESERKTKKMKDGGKVKTKGMGLVLEDRDTYKRGAERDLPAAKKMLEETPKRPTKDATYKSKKMKSGGMVKRDGCAVRGKTKGRMV